MKLSSFITLLSLCNASTAFTVTTTASRTQTSLNMETSSRRSVLQTAATALSTGFGLWYFANITFSWVGVGVYVLIGFLWLLFKFRRYVAKMIETETENIKIKKELTTKSEMKHKIWNNIEFDVIFFWGIAWPFSVLGFFLYDFMEILWEKFKKLVGGYVDKMIVAAGFTD